MYGSRSPASIAGSFEKVIDEEILANNRPDSRSSGLSSVSGPEDSTTYNVVRSEDNFLLTSRHNHVVVNENSSTDRNIRECELPSPLMFTTLPPPGVLVSRNQPPFVIPDSSFLRNANPPSFPNLYSLPSARSFNLGQQIPSTGHYQTARSEEKNPLLPEHQNQESAQFKNDQKAAAGEQRPYVSPPKHGFGNSEQTPPIHFGFPVTHHSLPTHHDPSPLHNVFYVPQFGSQWIPTSQAQGPYTSSFRYEPPQNIQHSSSGCQPLYPPCGSQPFAYPIHNPHMMCTIPGAGNPLISGFQQGLVASTECSSGRVEDTEPLSKTIQILGVEDSRTASKCKYYFENPEKGGGEIQEAKWDSIDRICYITFSDMTVAKRAATSLHKINDLQLETSLVPRGIPISSGMRTVKIIGGDVQYPDTYKLYFENPQNGGGPISSMRAMKEARMFLITFADTAVAEKVCSQKHIIQGHLLAAKPLRGQQLIDVRCDPEHVGNSWTTVEVIVGQKLKNEMFYRRHFETCTHSGLVEEIILKRNEGKILVTFNNFEAAHQVSSCRHTIDGKEVQLSVMKTSPFYSEKLLFRNVPETATKELLINYMENVSGQDIKSTNHSDKPGDLLVIFQEKIDFQKIRQKCQAKLLCGDRLEVCRVPVSSCVLVENLNPMTSDDEVAHYFESQQRGGTVLSVQREENHNVLVFFKDPEVAERVAMMKHRLGGRELGTRLYIECLGLSIDREDPSSFVLPEPLELSVNTNIKVSFLRHSPEMLQTFNESLLQVYARARIVKDSLKVECTLKDSVHDAPRLAGAWRDKAYKQLENCFDSVRLDRQEVLPEVWPDVLKAVQKCEISSKNLLLTLAEEHAFVILGRKKSDGDTFAKIKRIVEDTEKELAFEKSELHEVVELKRHERHLLDMSSLFANTEEKYNRLSVREENGQVVFRGQVKDVRNAQLKMLQMFRSAPSMTLTNVSHGKRSLLANESVHNFIRPKLASLRLTVTWDCQNEGLVTFFCLEKSHLYQAVEIIHSSLQEKVLSLDETSSWVTASPNWKKLKDYLIKSNQGTLMIETKPKGILITAISEIMSEVKNIIQNFVSENAIYSTVFRFSPSRQKFLALFWEKRLESIKESLSDYNVDIRLCNKERSIHVKGTKQGVELSREQLESLEKEIKCTEVDVNVHEFIKQLEDLNLRDLDSFAKSHHCVVALSLEKNGMQAPLDASSAATYHAKPRTFPTSLEELCMLYKRKRGSVPEELKLYIFTDNKMNRQNFLKAHGIFLDYIREHNEENRVFLELAPEVPVILETRREEGFSNLFLQKLNRLTSVYHSTPLSSLRGSRALARSCNWDEMAG
ncbi:uncharacterized protein LOC112564359 isoform X2 [Pomacea canaliculata]|uniref:uncharacterized protein LOC112564359 isoform X2 n=1 Tax=Pomacea canaliculata TaxID=400727 RepID=UPI000D734861|nr:uncharacterized protein LOC112564359 isoform X2 [Pomacea canaliculata]